MDKKWFVYILICNDQTFYTGITKNLKSRELAHNLGKGSAYTRVRKPVKIIYSENNLSQSEALKREVQIKSLTRKEKENLIKCVRPKLNKN
jgi:putative endonuclease